VNSIWQRRVTTLVIPAFMVLGLAGAASADSFVIPAGSDNFTTVPGPVGSFAGLDLPAGFFGPGSLPFVGQVNFEGAAGASPPPGISVEMNITLQTHGSPWSIENSVFVPCPSPNAFGECEHTAPMYQHTVFSTPTGEIPDTTVTRTQTVTLTGVGSTGTTPLLLESLSLRSVSPIQIDFTNRPPLLENVYVSSDGLPQTLGSMDITQTSSTGGTFDSVLHVTVNDTFSVPEPSTLLLFIAGLGGLLGRRKFLWFL